MQAINESKFRQNTPSRSSIIGLDLLSFLMPIGGFLFTLTDSPYGVVIQQIQLLPLREGKSVPADRIREWIPRLLE
jgi:hypothetical protein